VVTVIDNTPPVINSIVMDPACLWAPNHKYVFYEMGTHILVDAWDNCDPDPVAAPGNCVSDEPDNATGIGDGNTVRDCIIDGNLILARSERAGTMDGRIYTVEVTVTDFSGNVSTGGGTIEVRHDQSDEKCPKTPKDRILP